MLLVGKGLAVRRDEGERSQWIAFAAWTRSRHHAFAFALMLAVNVFYILAVNALGFIVTGVVYLGALFWVFRVRARWVVPLAIVVTLAIHYAFYKLLKVPLPWGLLQGIGW
jgi:putative tricarboxylic transport membrane protein